MHRGKKQMMSQRIMALGMALCLSLGALSAQAQQREPLDRIAVVVNEGAVMVSELNDRIEQTKMQLQSRGIEIPPNQILSEQVADRMILEEIQLQRAQEANLSVDPTELNRQLRAVAEGNGMSLEQFADRLEADGMSLGVVREQVRREMLMRELQQREVASRVNLSESEVDRFIEQQGNAISREQARQELFQRKVNGEMETWLQEIRADAFVDERLGFNS
ncbi:SurA N-terminal domain-containing protein [Halomonas halocynthiae]|uniref:SurA N-terminal domain-containing protein n=1 Tax=Halomonas halocynthiae TaxID=176290 RepID=UPI0003F6D51C|nr:SurA N-terminal domain-containing protein [Halomonas halocynthiae]